MKQTVMTSVYGVTYIGAREQIKRRLKERGAIADDAELFGASCYAAKVMEGGRRIDTISNLTFMLNNNTLYYCLGRPP